MDSGLNSGAKGARRYREVFEAQVEPFINKERNLDLQAMNYRFIDDLLCGYLSEKIPAPMVSHSLVSILKMPNLNIVELMSDLRDIRHDIAKMALKR